MLFLVGLHFNDVSFLSGSHTTAIDGKNFPGYFIIPKKDCNYFLLEGEHYY